MKVGAAIYSMLKDDSAVSALVGTRIYPELAEEGAATPYVVYSVVSNTPVDTKDSAPVDEAQLEVFSVADTYAAANDLADKVRAALSRKSQIVYETVTVQSVKYTNEVTEVSAERNLFISVQDYTVRTTPVLTIANGAVGAFGLRKLNNAYTGAAIRVRNSGDDSEQDIGFTAAGDLDTTSLLSFVGSNDARITTWYDQSGRGNDGTQTVTTDQPYIVTAGVLETSAGKAAIRFETGTTEEPIFNSIEFDHTDFNPQNRLDKYLVTDTTDDRYLLWTGAEAGGRYGFNANSLTPNDLNIFGGYGSPDLYVNGVQKVAVYGTTTIGTIHTYLSGRVLQVVENANPTGWTDFHFSGYGSPTNAFGYQGKVQEIIIFNKDNSANREYLQNNINAYYNIY